MSPFFTHNTINTAMKHQSDFDTGWSTNVWVEVEHVTKFSFYGDFRCSKCGDKLESSCIMVSKSNFKHSGKETDSLRHYNHGCEPSEHSHVWSDWRKEQNKILIEMHGNLKKYNLTIENLTITKP